MEKKFYLDREYMMILISKRIKKGIKISSIEFLENGLKISQESGETDIYNYSWLIKHEVKIEKR